MLTTSRIANARSKRTNRCVHAIETTIRSRADVHGPRDSPVASGVPAENAIRTYKGSVLHGHVQSHNLTKRRNPTSSVNKHARPSSTLLRLTTSACLRCVVHLLCIRATPFPSSQCDGRGCLVHLPPKRISRPVDGESRPSNADPTAQMDPPRREKTLQVRLRPTPVPPDTVHNCVFATNPPGEGPGRPSIHNCVSLSAEGPDGGNHTFRRIIAWQNWRDEQSSNDARSRPRQDAKESRNKRHVVDTHGWNACGALGIWTHRSFEEGSVVCEVEAVSLDQLQRTKRR